MSKLKKKNDNGQLNLFELLKPETPPPPGSMDISMRLRHAVSNAIKKSGKDRIDICAEIYKLSGKEVPKSTLDGWSAESRDLSNDSIDFNGNKRWGISGDVIPAFCAVTVRGQSCLFEIFETIDGLRIITSVLLTLSD